MVLLVMLLGGDVVGEGVGVGVDIGNADSVVGKLPWRTPTVTEVSFDDLPTELRMMALGLPVPEPNGWNVVLESGTAPPLQPEIQPEHLPF